MKNSYEPGEAHGPAGGGVRKVVHGVNSQEPGEAHGPAGGVVGDLHCILICNADPQG